MNKIIKLAVAFGIVGPALLASSAFAATNQTFLTLDGLSNNTYTVGSTFNARLSFDLTGNDTLQSVKWEILNAANQPVLPFECQDVDPDFLTAGSYVAEFVGHTMGGSQGTWKVRVSTYGVAVPGANNNCTGVPVSTRTYNNVLTLTNDNSSGTIINNTGSGTGSTGTPAPGTWQAAIAAINAQIAQLIALMAHPTTPAPAPTPVPSGVCADLMAYAGLYQGMSGPQVGALQQYLMAHGGTIGFGATSYFGPQTNAALFFVRGVNHCN